MEEGKLNTNRTEKIKESLVSSLVEGERIEAIACQERLYTILPIFTGGNLFPYDKA